MSDHGNSFGDTSRATSLARIADALGLPVSYFDGARDVEQIIHHAKLDDAAVLALVEFYLRTVDQSARSRFANTVRALVDNLYL